MFLHLLSSVCVDAKLENPTQPNPTQPNPTQPNPTQPNKIAWFAPQYHESLVIVLFLRDSGRRVGHEMGHAGLERKEPLFWGAAPSVYEMKKTCKGRLDFHDDFFQM